MHVLVTGGLGHIGSELIRRLAKNCDVRAITILDNLLTQRYASLFNLPKGVNFRFVEDDILKADMKVLSKDIDVIIHLAAITDAPSSFDRREEVEQVNYEGTRLVSEACIEIGADLFFPSTTSVYGTQSEMVDENCSIEELNPQSPYAEYKLKSEQMLRRMGDKQGLKFVICRL
ncbi:MAG: SDR family oxidoreductase, partial [Gammaproteobacteria bacterium]|nr:SDR family oxidoreductase [Gammaproteobacteria bacterium]